MIHKWSLLVIFPALFLSMSIKGYGDKINQVQPKPVVSVNQVNAVEAKVGYFFFSSAKMRKIYDRGGIDVQISQAYPVWKWFQIYFSAEFIERNGRSLNKHQKTRIWEYPLTLGLKTVFKICPVSQYYITLGPRYVFVHVHNNSSFVNNKMNQNGLGGFLGTGFNFLPIKHMILDVFGEYSYARMHFHASKKHTQGESTQVGGFAFGGGIGYAF